jgi:2-C-methyl-D-erythritol 2,4-cyclodiphosphate synthase
MQYVMLCSALQAGGILATIFQMMIWPSQELIVGYVYDDLKAAGWQVSNVDSTVVAQVPKLAPYIPQMRELLATDLHIESSEINIKATTTEKLGFVGRQEGIAAHAVALIQKAESV